jgi:hypothetical protein
MWFTRWHHFSVHPNDVIAFYNSVWPSFFPTFWKFESDITHGTTFLYILWMPMSLPWLAILQGRMTVSPSTTSISWLWVTNSVNRFQLYVSLFIIYFIFTWSQSLHIFVRKSYKYIRFSQFFGLFLEICVKLGKSCLVGSAPGSLAPCDSSPAKAEEDSDEEEE